MATIPSILEQTSIPRAYYVRNGLALLCALMVGVAAEVPGLRGALSFYALLLAALGNGLYEAIRIARYVIDPPELPPEAADQTTGVLHAWGPILLWLGGLVFGQGPRLIVVVATLLLLWLGFVLF